VKIGIKKPIQKQNTTKQLTQNGTKTGELAVPLGEEPGGDGVMA